MPTQKGLSELIAVVMMVAFVVAVAVLVSNFASSFTRSQINKVEEEGSRTADCNLANIEIDTDGVKNAANTLRVTVKNTGRLDLTNVDLVYRNTSTSEFQTVDLNASVSSGQIKTLELKGFSNAVDRIIATTDCPGKTAAVENVSGTFKKVT